MTRLAAPPVPSPLLTIEEAAAVCRCCPRTVRRLIAAGHLAGVRIGGRVLVHRNALEQLIGPLGVAPARADA